MKPTVPSRPAQEFADPNPTVATPVASLQVPEAPGAWVAAPAISLSVEQLQAIINSAVTAAIQATGNQGANLSDAIAAMNRNAPRRKVTAGEYDPKTFVQPDKGKTLKLNRDCYQNGTPMYAENLSNPEIALLNRITHSGRYLNRVVEVVVASNGTVEEVYLR